MPELREVESAVVARIERGGGIVRGKDNERIEQLDHALLLLSRKRCKGVARRLGFATVAQDNFHQVDAATIVAVWRSCADAPERGGEKLRAGRTVEVPFIEIRAKIVSLKIGEDVSDQERLQPGLFQRGKTAVVVDCIEQWIRGGEEVVENAAFLIKHRLEISHAAISIYLQVRHMTPSTTDAVEEPAPPLGLMVLLIQGRFEIVEQVELHEVDEAGGNFIR